MLFRSHDADVYGAHPGFLAAVYPVANARPEWFFIVCRPQCQGGRRRAGPGAYRLGAEARLLGGTAYCHAFRYYEDEADFGSASTKETEWRMDEYGDRRSAAAVAAFDMVGHRSLVSAASSSSSIDKSGTRIPSPTTPNPL